MHFRERQLSEKVLALLSIGIRWNRGKITTYTANQYILEFTPFKKVWYTESKQKVTKVLSLSKKWQETHQEYLFFRREIITPSRLPMQYLQERQYFQGRQG